MTALHSHIPRGSVHDLLGAADARGLLIATSKDPDAKITFIMTGSPAQHERLAVKIPTTELAGDAVEREAHMLVELRRLGLGELGRTVPRYVQTMWLDGLPVLVSSALPGTPMSVAYHSWRHTSRRRPVAQDFALAQGWLAEFQAQTARDRRICWGSEVREALSARWAGSELLPVALRALDNAVEHVDAEPVTATASHGDYWFGNLMVDRGRISGVVDWEHAKLVGSPLADLARFVLSYSLYLDRHTAEGAAVPGHHGLRRTGFAPGMSFALHGSGWYPQRARDFLREGLERLGLSGKLWYDVAVVGIAEVAANANDHEFGERHLALLADLPRRRGVR